MRKRPERCFQCGRKGSASRNISYRGLCTDCGTARVRENIMTMVNGDGPTYEKWIDRQRLGFREHLGRLEREAARIAQDATEA